MGTQTYFITTSNLWIIFENLIYKEMYPHLTIDYLISSNQLGFKGAMLRCLYFADYLSFICF